MKYIFFILLSLLSFKSFAAVDYPISVVDVMGAHPKGFFSHGTVFSSESDLKAAFQLDECVPEQYNPDLHVIVNSVGNPYHSNDWGGEYAISFKATTYLDSSCSRKFMGNDGSVFLKRDNSPPPPEPEPNYCDTIQYGIDKDAAEKRCFDSANTETQEVNFTASCDRENQVLVSQCEINDKPVDPPKPELCPDGSSPPCDDTGGGGGGSGGGSDNVDLTGVIEAINNANKTITGAVNDGHPAVNDLLNIQTEALSTSVESNRLLGVGIAALDVSNDALSNIANLTQDLNDKTTNEVSQSVESNRLLGVGIAALDVSNDTLANIANLTKDLNNKTANEVSQSIETNRLLGIGNDKLSNIAALTQGLNNTVTNSNDLLTGINVNTDKTNELLSNIDKTIVTSNSNMSNELSKILGSLISENKNNNSNLINKLDELEENANKHDLTYDGLEGIADSADKFVDANLNTYDTFVQTQIIDAVTYSPMKEALFHKVKSFFNDLIPISSTCQNLSFGDYFTIDCSKFQKFRDIFGFFIYVYTALTLIDILFTGIVPNPARRL